MPGEAMNVTLSRPTPASVPRIAPRTTAGFSSAGTLAAQECTISSVRSSSRPTSTPINAAGTMPKFESAE